jgi:CO dehydrogenase/acetyl-CoA synthase beta subunit
MPLSLSARMGGRRTHPHPSTRGLWGPQSRPPTIYASILDDDKQNYVAVRICVISLSTGTISVTSDRGALSDDSWWLFERTVRRIACFARIGRISKSQNVDESRDELRSVEKRVAEGERAEEEVERIKQL